MQLRRTPTRSRVADAWFRRARDTRPSGGDTLFKQFLRAMGDRKVRAPGHEGEVTINTLNSSDEDSDKKRLQEEYAKWSDGDPGSPGLRGAVDTPQKLKAVQDDLVEDAVRFGVPEATARDMVRGLNVGDSPDAFDQVEKNLQRVIDKAVADKKTSDAADKAQRDEAEAAEREERERAEAEADALTQLKKYQDKLIDDAVKAGVPEEGARALAKELKVGDTDDALDEVREALKPLVDKAKLDSARNQTLQRAEDTAKAVEDARAALEAAKKSKNKDYTRDPDAPEDDTRPKTRQEAIARAKSDLLKAEDVQYWASVEADKVNADRHAEEMAGMRAEAATSKESVEAAVRDYENARRKYDEAEAEGDETAKAEAEAEAVAAGKRVEGLLSSDAAIQRRLSQAETDAKKDQKAKAEAAFAKARKRNSQGMVLFNEKGEMVRYDPSKSDKIYEMFMTLLGETITKRPIPDMEGSTVDRSYGRDTDKDGIFDTYGPTKSGMPRNSDGSSPTGGETEEYGPHEFWMVNPSMWSAKDGKGNHRTFPTKDKAEAYAKKASSMPSRVASRHLLRYQA